jgi:NAD(P)H dehydrogenase (quinone)
MGRTDGLGHIYQTGKFRGKRSILFFTTAGPEQAYRKGGCNGDISAILRPVQRGILLLTGFDVLAPQIHYAPARADETPRQASLDDWEKRLLGTAEEPPIEVGTY